MSSSRILVVGAGFSGAVVARELAKTLGKVLVIDERDHVAGNCHTQRDPESGVMVHQYGAHIFHTNREEVWNYLGLFTEFWPYVNRVKASTRRGIFSLPVNLQTINQFFGKQFSTEEAREFIRTHVDATIGEPQNFEEQALKSVGRELYDMFFYGYTKKQWGCEPRELPVSLFGRFSVRFDDDDSYFRDRFQGIPRDGYTVVVERMLTDENIELKLGTRWHPGMVDDFAHIIFTGPLDLYYDHQFGRLGYRTVYWDRTCHHGDYQGHAVMNFPETEIPHTRKVEHKHLMPWESHEKTVVFTEYSKETTPTDTPFYPKRLASDKALLAKYLELARRETRVSFLGRLATYRYLDMHQVIGEALDFAPVLTDAIRQKKRRPVFPANF